MFTKLSAQETFDFTTSIGENLSKSSLNSIFPVEQKSIEYYPVVEGEINTREYQYLLDKKNELQEYYESYRKSKKQDSVYFSKMLKISDLLNTYTTTSKNEILLDDANKLVKELNLYFIVDNQSSFYSGMATKPKEELYIINNKGKYASTSMIKDYTMAVNNRLQMRQEIVPSYQVKAYLETLKEISNFPEKDKTKLGKSKSLKPTTKNAYVMLEDQRLTDYNNIVGKFKIVENKMSLYHEDADFELLPAEQVDKSTSSFYVLVENIDTGKLYAINNYGYNQIKYITAIDLLNDKLISLGYEPYRSEGYPQLYVNTTYYKVQAMPYLYDEIQKDSSYLKKLDQHYLKVIGLKKQANTYNSKFENYLRMYKLQRNQMSTASINNWTALTKSGIQLLKQIVKLNEDPIESDCYPLNEKLYYDTSFADYVGASRNVLGL